MEYPECEKLAKVAPESQKLGNFLDWLREHEYFICEERAMAMETGDEFAEFYETRKSNEAILAEFFEIDLAKVETERRALLEMTMEKENKTAELEVTAKLADVQIHTREICDKWILLTYDLPHNEVGDKARREFLLHARKLGACQHTESVYLLPYSAAAGEACLELAKAGKLFVWTSESTDTTQAQEVTRNYDQEMKRMLKKLSERVDRMIELRKASKFGILNKMREKTDTMISDLGDAVRRRESLDLAIMFQAICSRYRYA